MRNRPVPSRDTATISGARAGADLHAHLRGVVNVAPDDLKADMQRLTF